MTVDCTFVHDHDEVSRISAAHVAACEACRRNLALRARARETWRLAKARDDEGAATSRERRVLVRLNETRERSFGARPAVALAVGMALFAATATAMVVSGRGSFRTKDALESPRSVTDAPPVEAPPIHAPPVATVPPIQAPPVEAPPVEVQPDALHEPKRPLPREDRADDGDGLWRSAEDALARGDRAAAEAFLRVLLRERVTREASLATKAELRLAELLLARGAALEARARLEPLALGREPRVASDAVWLYVRSFPEPSERAEAWERFLARGPAAEMHDLGSIERAGALLEAGDREGARAIAAQLDGKAVGPLVADALRRLRARLGASG